MADKFLPIQLPPGVFRNGTKYQAKGRWYDSHLVRWYDGAIRPVGGWGAVRTSAGVAIQLTGFPRTALAWRRNDGSAWIGVGTTGTTSKLYVLSSGVLTDVTPAGLVNGAADGAYTTGAGRYGKGPYGFGLYGQGSTAQTLTDADTWALDNFGDLLIANLTADGKIYSQTGTSQATVLANAPVKNRAVVVTPERFVFALGGEDLSTPGAGADARLVQWPDQESLTLWTPATTNQAGNFPLTTHGSIVAGRRTTRETLIWTDVDVHAATYVGGDLVYAFEQRAEACGLYGPNAVATVGQRAYWMSENKFFQYDGAVREIACEVSDFVFPDINRSQRAKVFAIAFPEFSEVMWLYPSAANGSAEPTRYVAYNYQYGFWMVGALQRSAGAPAGATRYPIMLDSAGILYEHEVGDTRTGAAVPYLESGPVELGDGDQFMDAQRLIPDENTLGDVQAIFYAANFPTDTEATYGPYSLATPTDVRFSARQVRIRLQQNVERSWRVGVFRLGVIPAERR